MLDILFAAKFLAVLSSIPIQRTLSPVVSVEEHNEILSYFDSSQDNLSFLNLFDLNGESNYFLVSDSESYIIYDARSFSIKESGRDNPYSSEKNYKIYNTSVFASNYLETDGKKIWESSNIHFKIDLSETSIGYNGFDYDVINYTSEIPANAHKCLYYEYFTKLKDRHGYNKNSLCTLIANEILLGYYDTFYKDYFVPEKWDNVSFSFDNITSWKSFQNSPGTGKKETNSSGMEDNRMRDFTLDYCKKNVNSNIESNGLNCSDQIKVLKNSLSMQNVSYELSCVEGNLLDCINNKNQSFIKSVIDAGRPLIANGSGHSTVAFAYDDNYVYVHTGYGRCGKTPWSTYTTWSLSYMPSSIDIKPTGNHIHSNNYYSNSSKRYYCPCGYYSNSQNVPLDDTSNAIIKLNDGSDITLTSSNVTKQTNNYLLFSTNQQHNAYLQIDAGTKYIKSMSFSLKYNLDSYVPEDFIEVKTADGTWSNYDIPIVTSSNALGDNSINFRCLNLPNDTSVVRIASNYVEYQHQQLSIANVCVEMN